MNRPTGAIRPSGRNDDRRRSWRRRCAAHAPGHAHSARPWPPTLLDVASGFGQWIWYRSIASTPTHPPSRRQLAPPSRIESRLRLAGTVTGAVVQQRVLGEDVMDDAPAHENEARARRHDTSGRIRRRRRCRYSSPTRSRRRWIAATDRVLLRSQAELPATPTNGPRAEPDASDLQPGLARGVGSQPGRLGSAPGVCPVCPA